MVKSEFERDVIRD